MITRFILIINLFPPERLVFPMIRDFRATNSVEIQFHFHLNTSYIALPVTSEQCNTETQDQKKTHNEIFKFTFIQ